VTITVNTPDGGTASFPDGTPTSTMTSALQAKFGGPATASAPATNDYSNSPWSARLRTLENAATLGLGDKIYSLMSGTPLAEVKGNTAAAESSLPWYERLPIEGAGYALGGGALLGSGLGEAGLGADAIGTVGSMALEGAGAGAINTAAGTDPSLGNIATGAAGGALLGGAAGGLTKGINAGSTKLFGKPGSIDPDAAIAATEAAKTAKYQDLHASTAPTFSAGDTAASYVNAANSLTDVQRGDVSKDFVQKMQQHVNQMRQTGDLSAGAVDEYARSIQDAAEPNNNAEQVLAARIRDGLTGDNGVLATATPTSNHPVGQAATMLNDAQAANKQWEMAKNLAEWTRLNDAGASLGQAPLTEAERFYQGKPQYQPLVDLYQKSQSQNDPSWALGHMAASALGDLGGMAFGFPGHLAMEALGYLGFKPAIKSAFKGAKQNALGKGIQQLYPQTTGQPLTGAQTGPQVGDSIKNLMLGSVY
jgi:hypothetical protein